MSCVHMTSTISHKRLWVNNQSDIFLYHTSDMGTFGERLREARKEAKLTQGQLASKSGLSQTTISDIERGRNAGSTEAPALAAVLGVEALWLSDGKLPKYRSVREPGDDTVINPDIPGVYSAVYSPDNLSKLTIDQLRSALAARLANVHEQEAKHQINLLDYETWKSRPSGEDPTPRMRRTDNGPILKKIAQRK